MSMIIIVEVGFFIVLASGRGWRQRMKFVYCGSTHRPNKTAPTSNDYYLLLMTMKMVLIPIMTPSRWPLFTRPKYFTQCKLHLYQQTHYFWLTGSQIMVVSRTQRLTFDPWDFWSQWFQDSPSDMLDVLICLMFSLWFSSMLYFSPSYDMSWCFAVWDVLMLLLAGRLSRAEPINQRTTAQLSPCQIGNNNAAAGKRKKPQFSQQLSFQSFDSDFTK